MASYLAKPIKELAIKMTVLGTNLVQNCRACFTKHGYGIALKSSGKALVCPNCHASYVVEGGYAKRT